MASLADELAKLSAEVPEGEAEANWGGGAKARQRRPSKEINPAGEAETYEAIKAVFKEFDRDGSGAIDESELSFAVMKLGIQMDNASLLRMLREADADSNGTIELHEFETIVQKAASQLGVIVRKKQEGGAPLRFCMHKRGNGITLSDDGQMLAADGPVGQSVQLITVDGGEPTEDDDGTCGDCWLSDNTRVGHDLCDIILQVDKLASPDDFFVGIVGSNYFYGDWEGALNNPAKGGKHAAAFCGKDGMLYAKATECYGHKLGRIEEGMKIHFAFDLKGGSEGPEFTVELISGDQVTHKCTIYNGLIDGYSLPPKMALAVCVGRGQTALSIVGSNTQKTKQKVKVRRNSKDLHDDDNIAQLGASPFGARG